MYHISTLQHKLYDNTPFIYLQACSKWHGYLSFKEKKLYILKPMYFVKLFKQDETKDKTSWKCNLI
jgi:hypothetical protein